MAIKISGTFRLARKWVYRTAPDDPVPIVVIVNHSTRRSSLFGNLYVQGSAVPFGKILGSAADTQTHFGNGCVVGAYVTPAGQSTDCYSFTTFPTFPTVGGSIKGVCSVQTVSAIAGDGDWPFVFNALGGAPEIHAGLNVYGLSIEWCFGHLFGKRTGNTSSDAFRQNFLDYANGQGTVMGGIANLDFLVVEARIHQYSDVNAGRVCFREGDVVYDANGSAGLTGACAYVDANY